MREKEKVKMEICNGKIYFFSCVQEGGKEVMEKAKLEDILEKLEKIDIRCWNLITEKRGFDITNNILTAENNGLKFYLDKDCLSIEDLETGCTIGYDYRFDKQHKAFKKAMEEFYKKTCTTLRNYHNGKIEEKLKNFLTD